MNEEIYRRMNPPKPPENGDNDGTLILDAMATPVDIRYATDISLLNECREATERIVDEIWEHTERKGHKTSYNRRKAQARYLRLAKQRKPRKNKIKQAVREQLSYVERNLEALDKLASQANEGLHPKQVERPGIIRDITRQQREMLDSGKNTCENRAISLRQPHVRPIVRGKARNPVEFDQKIATSVVYGFTFIEKQSWNNFNEGITLIESAKKFKARHGVYPAVILADTIYRNRENRAFCKENGIRLSGPRLGRPKASEQESDREPA